MNAIQFLVSEHDKVRSILNDINDDSHRHETKVKLFDELSQELIRHETMEEEIWYPYLKSSQKLNGEIKHLISEEKHAEKAIKALNKVEGAEKWNEKFSEFKKAVEQHANEEEKELFPKVEKLCEKAELEQIAKKMLEFKRAYKK